MRYRNLGIVTVLMQLCVWFLHRAWRESKTMKISSGVSSGVFTEVCTRGSFPLYSICMFSSINQVYDSVSVCVDVGYMSRSEIVQHT